MRSATKHELIPQCFVLMPLIAGVDFAAAGTALAGVATDAGVDFAAAGTALAGVATDRWS